jgi:hypothetical protein
MAIGINWGEIWAESVWNTSIWLQSDSIPGDTVPLPFTFSDQSGVPLSTLITSDYITVAGITAASPISVVGGSYEVLGGGGFQIDPSTVVNGDMVRVRHTSSASYLGVVNTTLTIGGVSDTFSSETVDITVTPSLPSATPRSRTFRIWM